VCCAQGAVCNDVPSKYLPLPVVPSLDEAGEAVAGADSAALSEPLAARTDERGEG
jgi:hypothetical protein